MRARSGSPPVLRRGAARGKCVGLAKIRIRAELIPGLRFHRPALTKEYGIIRVLNRACTSVPRHLWLSLQALETKVEAQGYKVQKSRLTSTCAAFEALNSNGARVELFVDPTNGEVVGKV